MSSADNKLKSEKQKMVILGDGGVGKTTLLRVLKNTEGDSNIFNTRKTAFLEVETVKLETDEILFYDLAGQDSTAHPLEVLPDLVLKNASLILLAFSLDRFSSLNNLQNWFKKIKDYYVKRKLDMPDIILIGTKSDLKKRIDDGLIKIILSNVAEIIDYIPISSYTNQNIENLKKRINLYIQELPEEKLVEEYEKLLEQESKEQPDLPDIAKEVIAPVVEPVPITPQKPEPIVQMKQKSEPEPIIKTELEPVIKTKPEPIVQVKQEPEPVIKTKPVPIIPQKPEPIVQVRQEPEPEPEIGTEPEPVNKTKPEHVVYLKPVPTIPEKPEPTVQVEMEPEKEISNQEKEDDESRRYFSQIKRRPQITKEKVDEFYLVWKDDEEEFINSKPNETNPYLQFIPSSRLVKIFIPNDISRIRRLNIKRKLDSVLRTGLLTPQGLRLGRDYEVEELVG